MSRSAKTETSLEQYLDELKLLLEQMEQKDLSLEDSLAKFQRGIELVRVSQKMLHEAEQKIQILLASDGNETLESFATES